MILTAKVKLITTPEQKQALVETLREANKACHTISGMAWDRQIFGQFQIHKFAYHHIRETTNLGAQMVVRAIRKVADSYKLDRKTRRKYSWKGGFPYDNRILRWYTDKKAVSIWTVEGREYIPYQSGDHQDGLLQFQKGESDLAYYKGEFYLFASCEIDEPPPGEFEGIIGVDMGVTNIAATSDGDIETSKKIDAVRQRYTERRAILQSVSTKSAKRRLKKISKRENNFRKHINHCISRRLVDLAKHTHRAIAVEDLKGIRKRTRVRKGQRSQHSGWSFYQLRQFIEYKAALIGVTVFAVNPKYTSQECSRCGYIAKANRKSQSEFICVECGYSIHADLNASINIASRVDVNQPMVSPDGNKGQLSIASPLEGRDNTPLLAAV